MENKIKRKLRVYILSTLITCLLMLTLQVVFYGPSNLVEASTYNNVVVASVDYVDQKIAELTQRINSISTGSSTTYYPSSGTSASSKEVVDLKEQVTVITEKNDELSMMVDSLSNMVRILSEMSQASVVKLEYGQSLFAETNGTKIVVRSGEVEAIEGINGDGLADITTGDGIDLKNGDIVPNDHNILISRVDGRGVKALSSVSYIMVFGSYSLKLSK